MAFERPFNLRNAAKQVPGATRIVRTFKWGLELIRTRTALDVSQNGEQAVLQSLIPPSSPEFLVDVGAHDGVTGSNSRALIVKGWSGILVEPLPIPFHSLEKRYRRRSNVTCLNLACSNASGYEDFFIGTDGDAGFMSTLCRDENSWFDFARSSNKIVVKVAPLTELLIRYGCPRDFSLLLIDAEGMDYEVLEGLSFERFSPRIIVTEEYEGNPAKHRRKYDLLTSAGYRLETFVGCNTIWVSSKRR